MTKRIVIPVIIFLICIIVAVFCNLFKVLEGYQQVFIIALSTAATYLIVIMATDDQAKKQEAKEKTIKLYENKLNAYSESINLLWKTDSDNSKETKIKLKDSIFDKLIFYLSDNLIIQITKIIQGYIDGCNNNEDKKKDIEDLSKMYADITTLLKQDLERKETNKNHEENLNEKKENPVFILRRVIDDLMNILEDENKKIYRQHNKSISEGVNKDTIKVKDVPPSLNQTFWHFAMWGADEQLKALSNGVYELNLVEYSEDWRTNLLKQVKKDDLVFLFRSGGWGYMGVYRVLGWRVFELKNDGSETETINVFGNPIQEFTKEEDSSRYTKDLERSDIYWIREPENREGENSYNFCSSIIVEPLAFASDGIGNPGGVYRRTISRYDYDYGLMQLSRFMAIMDDETTFDVYYNEDKPYNMGCKKELFKKILASGNIKPAERNENGEWI